MKAAKLSMDAAIGIATKDMEVSERGSHVQLVSLFLDGGSLTQFWLV